ncbi:MAG: hypothetical protein AAF799_13300 [Myxococcota bacterium]
MAATSIELKAEDDGDPSPYVPLNGEVVLKAVPNDDVESYKWQVTGGLGIIGSSTGASVRLAGDRLDADIDDSTVSVTVDGGILTKTMKLTVVSVEAIVAEVTSTPATSSNTARAAMQLPAPDPTVFRSTNNRGDFSRGESLIMVSGKFPAVTLKAEVKPAGVPLVWSSSRNPEDGEGSDGLALSSTSGTEITIPTTAVGAYFVRAQVKVREGISTDADGMFKALPVVLIGVTAVADSSKFNNAFKVDSAIERLRFASESFEPPREARSFMYASGIEDFAELEAQVEVVSGGADGRLFLDDLKIAWIQTERGSSSGGAEMVGTYENGKKIEPALVSSRFMRGFNYMFDLAIQDGLKFPLPDAEDDQTPPTVVNRSGSQRTNNEGKGETWTIRGQDLPNVTLPLAFEGGDPIYEAQPGDEVLTKVVLDMQFSAYVCLWTRTVPQTFGVAYRLDWGLTGQWTVTVEPDKPMKATADQQPKVTSKGTPPNPMQAEAADTQGAEVLGPGNVEHIVLSMSPPN